MRILLDECLPRKLKNSLVGHECRTVPEEGLAGKKNGELLALAEKLRFHAFLTLDRGFEYQQNLQTHSSAVVLICVRSNRLSDLLPCVPDILKVLEILQPGQLIKIGQ